MLNIRTDRLANWLLYLAVLLGVIGTTAHAETTQLAAHCARRSSPQQSVAWPKCSAVRQDLEQRLPFNQGALIAEAELRVDESARDTLPAIAMGH